MNVSGPLLFLQETFPSLSIVLDACCVSPSGICYGEVISFISTSIEGSYQESILNFAKWFFCINKDDCVLFPLILLMWYII